MKMPTAPRWLTCLCALPLLASCGLWQHKPQAPARPTVIEVPVPAYRSLPGTLTDPIPTPPAPPARCMLGGVAAVCVLDGLSLLPMYDAALETCNADRARAALLGRADGP